MMRVRQKCTNEDEKNSAYVILDFRFFRNELFRLLDFYAG